MKTEDICFFVFTGMGFGIFIDLVYFEPLDDLTLVDVAQSLNVLIGALVLCCTFVLACIYRLPIMQSERKKKGLRPSWKNEDFDELEARIEKLEEKDP